MIKKTGLKQLLALQIISCCSSGVASVEKKLMAFLLLSGLCIVSCSSSKEIVVSDTNSKNSTLPTNNNSNQPSVITEKPTVNSKPDNTRDDTLNKEFPGLSKDQIAELKEIKAYCEKVDAVRGDSPPDMIFADVSDYLAKKRGKWRRFASEKALEMFRKKIEIYSDIAYVYETGGRIVAVNYMVSSPTGDWTKDVYQYYREDGSLALANIHFGTFIDSDGYKLDRYMYFDQNGRSIGRFDKWSNLSDEKIEPIEDGDTADLREKIDYYMTVSKLPFAPLLPQKAN
jgi:hypothetical protein